MCVTLKIIEDREPSFIPCLRLGTFKILMHLYKLLDLNFTVNSRKENVNTGQIVHELSFLKKRKTFLKWAIF